MWGRLNVSKIAMPNPVDHSIDKGKITTETTEAVVIGLRLCSLIIAIKRGFPHHTDSDESALMKI